MFPYPSGQGLHVGHPEGYTASDIVARYKRMKGFNVLHPMGWDAFGLPAEQHAIKTGTHPALTTAKNIANMRRQIKIARLQLRLGPRDRHDRPGILQVDAVDLPEALQQLLRRGPAEGQAHRASCRFPQGLSERGGDARYRGRAPAGVPGGGAGELVPGPGHRAGQRGSDRGRERAGRASRWSAGRMRQWMLRITTYAERLLEDLDAGGLARVASRSCRRTGSAQSDRRGGGSSQDRAVGRTTVERRRAAVFTTRPDTLFGATYMVLAPEHPLVDGITTPAAEGGGQGVPRRRRPARATSTGRTWPRRRPASSPARTPSTRSTARRFRSGSRLRADQLRHRRDHGRAGP